MSVGPSLLLGATKIKFCREELMEEFYFRGIYFVGRVL
jgi:hypothetical protein